MLIQHSQYLLASKDPYKALWVFEGNYDKSTVKALFQLCRSDCECMQTGICNAIMISRKVVKTNKTFKAYRREIS